MHSYFIFLGFHCDSILFLRFPVRSHISPLVPNGECVFLSFVPNAKLHFCSGSMGELILVNGSKCKLVFLTRFPKQRCNLSVVSGAELHICCGSARKFFGTQCKVPIASCSLGQSYIAGSVSNAKFCFPLGFRRKEISSVVAIACCIFSLAPNAELHCVCGAPMHSYIATLVSNAKLFFALDFLYKVAWVLRFLMQSYLFALVPNAKVPIILAL